MKENLINTFSSMMSVIICVLLIMGSVIWTNKSMMMPKIYNNSLPNKNKFL